MCTRCRCNHKLNKCPKDVYVKFVITPLVTSNFSYDNNITPLVTSNFSYDNNITPLPVENAEITCSDYVLAAYDQICYIGKVLENDLSDRTYSLYCSEL